MPMVTAGPEHVFEAETEAEADPFVPFILPLAAKALPAIGLAVVPTIRRLPLDAGRAIGSAVGSLLPGPSGKADGRASPTWAGTRTSDRTSPRPPAAQAPSARCIIGTK